MDNHSSNPYQSSATTDAGTMPQTRASRWHGFKTGFRNGALWSLLLVVPTVPTFFAEATIHRRIQRNTADGTTRIVELSTTESAFAWFVAIGSALTAITLPWSITAGCVGQARYRKKHSVE